jgi:SSS family solute:Na+ symporter
MHHGDFQGIAHNVTAVLSGITNPQIQDQMLVPVTLSHFLPPGFAGAFCAVMLAASITTDDTYLHSWGSILVQDVVMPFRSKPFTPKQHMRVLRFSILGVALFVFLFSLLFKQTEYIYMFFAITGAIFTGGAGAVIIGGLYWKRGTTAAAWSAMIIGSTLAVSGIVIRQIDPEFFLNGQVMWFISMIVSSTVYISVSLLGRRKSFNMDRLLHRGEYAITGECTAPARRSIRSISEWLGMGPEFTRGDKFIYFATIAWTSLWIIIFVVGTAYNFVVDVPTRSWAIFWGGYVMVAVLICAVVTLWLTIGGIIDMRSLYATLHTRIRDDSDNGTVAAWSTSGGGEVTEGGLPEPVLSPTPREMTSMDQPNFD